VSRPIKTMLVAVLQLGAVAAALGQDLVLDDAQNAARLLEAATNLPKILAPDAGLATAAERQQAFKAERMRLIEILKDDGYLRADIELQSAVLASTDSSTLRVRVNAGPRYTLSAVTVASTAAVDATLANEMNDFASAAVGSRADKATMDDISKRLKWLLGQNGYAFARVDLLSLVPVPDSDAAVLAIRVAPGQPSHFTGVEMTAVDLALHDAVGSIVPFAPGDLYSSGLVVTFRERLAALPSVAGTRVDVLPDGPAGFSLQIRAKRAYRPTSSTVEANLALGVLIAALAALALRQAAVSSRLGRFPVRLLTVASGGLLATSAGFLAMRVFNLL
jgi:outer membrane translocation and assembly module TamA